MKIAIPENCGEVNQHFGKSQTFAIIELDQNKSMVHSEVVSVAGLQHQHEGLARFLKGYAVDLVIVGGIGPGALTSLEAQGFQVLFGAAGQIKEVVDAFAKDQFVSERKVCNHHHEGHHHH